MYRKLIQISILILVALLAGLGISRAQEGDPGDLSSATGLGTAFTYQGRLSPAAHGRRKAPGLCWWGCASSAP